jgi:hypothetical protein
MKSYLTSIFAGLLFLSTLLFNPTTGRAQPCATPPAPDDWNWFGMHASSFHPSLNSAALSVMAQNGNVYIAGQSGADVRVAQWDGSIWKFLGEKIVDISGAGIALVRSIDVGANGDVYIRGIFSHADNGDGSPPVATSGIARWDAASETWGPVGQGVSSPPFGILKVDDVGGYVYVEALWGRNPDGTQVDFNRIGRWNMSLNEWETIGDIGVLEQAFNAMAIGPNGELVIAGYFQAVYDDNGTDVDLNHIALWDGSKWNSLGQGLDAIGFVNAIGISGMAFDGNGILHVAGRSDLFSAINTDGSAVNGPVVQWDGVAWTQLPHTGTPSGSPSLVIDGNDNIYLSYNLHDPSETELPVKRISRWDATGSAWIPIAEFTGFAQVTTLAANTLVNGDRLYAGGSFGLIVDPTGSAIHPISQNAMWDGTSWQEMSAQWPDDEPDGGTVHVLEIGGLSGETLYVGGSFSAIANVPLNNIAAFDGISWSSPGGGINGVVYDISNNITWGGMLFVGGDFTEAVNGNGSVVTANNIVQWGSGADWLPLGQGVDGPVRAVLPRVNFFNGAYHGGVVVAGEFTTAFNPDGSPVAVNSIAFWNYGSQEWEPVGQGITGGAGAVWTIAEGSTYGIPVSRPDIYIGGSFSGAVNADGSTVNSSNIIRWDPDTESWQAVGQGVDGTVRALSRGNLTGSLPIAQSFFIYVGGDFSQSYGVDGGAISTPYLSAWYEHNDQWMPLAAGLDAPVHAITPLNRGSDRAVIGGEFSSGYYPNGNSRFLNHIGIVSLLEPQTWFPLGFNAVNDTVRAVASVGICRSAGQNIFAGGDFTRAGYRSAQQLARWYYRFQPCYTGINSVAVPATGGGGSASIAVSMNGDCTSLASNYPVFFKTDGTMNEELLFDGLGYRESITFDSLFLNQYFSLSLYSADNPDNPIAIIDSLFIRTDNPGILIFSGVDDPDLYSPNPDGRSISPDVIIAHFDQFENQPGGAQIVFVNAVTDAPVVDISIEGGTAVVEGLAYGEASGQIELPPGNYTFEVRRSDGGELLGSFEVNTADLAERYGALVLSGFVDPAANNGGLPLSLDLFDAGPAVVVSVDEEDRPSTPETISLSQNFPNPFNPTTQIRYSLSGDMHVTIYIYNILGQLVKVLVDEFQRAGTHTVVFDAGTLSSGVYFYRLDAAGSVATKRMMYVK